MAGDVRVRPFNSEQVSFKAQPFTAQKQPDRAVGYPDTPSGQLVSQPMQRQMRLLVDPADNELPMGLKNPAAVTTHLAGRNLPVRR